MNEKRQVIAALPQKQYVLPRKLNHFVMKSTRASVPRVKENAIQKQQIPAKLSNLQRVLPSNSRNFQFVKNRLPQTTPVTISSDEYVCEGPPDITGYRYEATFEILNESDLPPGLFLFDDPLDKNPPVIAEELKDGTLYVNPRQYKYILKRRAMGKKLVEEERIPKERSRYMHQSRHLVAKNRNREDGGKFGNRKLGEETGRSPRSRTEVSNERSNDHEYFKMPMRLPVKMQSSFTQPQQQQVSVAKKNGIVLNGMSFVPLSKIKNTV